jgi:hypothetical protein
VNYNQPSTVEWPQFDDAGGLFEVDPAAHDYDDQPSPRERLWWPSGFAEWFALGFTFLPAILYLPGSQSYRLIARAGAYGISIAAFAIWFFDRGGRKQTKHPAERWLMMVTAWLVIMIAHPKTASVPLGAIQVALYFSILCPLLWVPAYVSRRRDLIRILAVILICNGLNSAVGVLQVYDPQRWMPRQLSIMYQGEAGRNALAAATYVGPNGREILRPPGLFDTPGAVCGAGTLAALLGLIFFLEPIDWWKRLAALGFAIIGLTAIYLSHVRSSFVVTLAMMAFYVALVTLQQQRKRAVGFVGVAVAIVTVALSIATILGGESVQNRFATLISDDPRTTYYQSRGVQVEYAFTDLMQQYPFGAGMARWGMVGFYFGSNTGALDEDVVFAEVQPNAWILDGGWPLLLLYAIALMATVAFDLRLVRSLADPADRLLAAIVVATNFGTLAFVFTFVPFSTAAGMQFWFLEGALHGAMANRPRSA